MKPTNPQKNSQAPKRTTADELIGEGISQRRAEQIAAARREELAPRPCWKINRQVRREA